MKKIPTIFRRDHGGARQVTDEIDPVCQWVIDGEGVARRKLDGTAAMIDGSGRVWKRRTVKQGEEHPVVYRFCDRDHGTGEMFVWVPAEESDDYIMEAIDGLKGVDPPGTYEVIGPKINGNPEKVDEHIAIWHDDAFAYHDVPRDFLGIKKWLSKMDIEGLVFHHADGRRAKIKKRDFGMPRTPGGGCRQGGVAVE